MARGLRLQVADDPVDVDRRRSIQHEIESLSTQVTTNRRDEAALHQQRRHTLAQGTPNLRDAASPHADNADSILHADSRLHAIA